MADQQVVVFELEGHFYGIDIEKIIEVQNYEPIRYVPNEAPYIEGIINVRGTVYPVINLRTRLHLSPYTNLENVKFILLNFNEQKVGFIVDYVAEILSYDYAEVEPLPSAMTEVEGHFMKGVIKRDEHMIILLDEEEIIAYNPLEADGVKA